MFPFFYAFVPIKDFSLAEKLFLSALKGYFYYLCAMNQNHIENKTHLLQYAMHAGIFLGCFWVLNYLLIIVGHDNPMLRSLNSILKIGTPLLLFYFLKSYKEKFLDNRIGLWHGIQFSILLFFFGSILEALIVLFHVKWLNPTFIATVYENIVSVAETFNFSPAMTAQLAEQANMSPFRYVFNHVIMNNVFIGFLLSLIIVPIIRRFKIVRNEP